MMKMFWPIKSEPKETLSIFYDKETEQEIVVSFFGECNLRCKFCCDYFRLDKKYSKEAIESRLQQTLAALDKIKNQQVMIKMFGGEFFMDKLSDDVFAQYDYYIESVKNKCKSLGKEVRFAITSNLIFHKRERVLDFCKKHNIELRSSFDLEGRFHSERVLEIFMDNLKWFIAQKYPIAVTMVFTKPSINHLMNDGPYKKYWNEIYQLVPTNLDYYSDVGLEGYSITEAEEAKALIYFYQHYPNIQLVKSLVDRHASSARKGHYCVKGVWIDDYTMYQCCDLNQINAEFLRKKQCFLCKHFSYCPGTCARIHQYEHVCHLKCFFDYLDHEDNSNLSK